MTTSLGGRRWLASHVSDFTQSFYVCGPPAMVNEISDTLKELGAKPESIVLEKSE
ncbi:hypothetical protein SH139x_001027 [Planctomycetaceae bacterium SH139]